MYANPSLQPDMPGDFLTLLPTRSQQGTRVSPREPSKPKNPSIYCLKDQWSGQEGREGGKEHKAEEDVLCTTIRRTTAMFLSRGLGFRGFPISEHGLSDAKLFLGAQQPRQHPLQEPINQETEPISAAVEEPGSTFSAA